ncbi:hypothetical protein ACJMK2_015856 [Sinanodonta woodiana]|uniref:Uncharacterized protein n=1 Tax=Sinanodonta woodiana TaxID=1069815 RepID=A0ABD3URR1_SINWO
MSVYDGIETSSWLGPNPAVTESLNRLKQLEELRKQRELQTREKLASIRSNRNYGSLRKSSLTDNEAGSRFLRRAPSSSDDESTIPAYRSGDVTIQLGGARPKLSSSISRDENNTGLGGEHDQWFSGVAESILGPSFTSRQLSPRKSMRNDRFTFSEDSDRSSKIGSLPRDSLVRSSFQGTLGHPSSRASKGSNNLFDGVLESAFSEGIIAPKISNLRHFASSKIDSNRVFTNSNNVNSEEYVGQESLDDNSPNGQYDISEESHIEESQHQEGENKTKMEEEEEEEQFDDPLEFSQSLKNFRNSNEIHCDNFQHNDNSAHKRTAHSGLLVGSVPTIPPLKKVKSVDLEDVNSDQYSDLPDMIHTYEDLTSVAKDIVATFSQPFSPDGLGPRSPSYKENVGDTQVRSGYDFSKSQPEILDENGHLKVPDFSAVNSDDQNDNIDSEKATFTSQSHNNIVRRTSSSKKKKRPPSFHRKGESEQNSDSENKMEKKTLVAVNGKDVQDSPASDFEQFTVRLTGLSSSDGPLVSVDTVQEEQNNGNKDGRVEHLGILHVTDSLYRSGSSEWVVINQDGQSDGKTVRESKKGMQVNGGESNSLNSNPDKENDKSIVPGSGLRRKLYSKGSQSQSSIDSQTLSPSAPEKKGLIARWKNMFGSFGHSDVTSELNLSNDTSDCVDETRIDFIESADQSVQPALIEERKLWTDENGSNDLTRSDDSQSADSSPRSDKGVLGRSSVAHAVMSDSDEAFETASDDSGNNRDRKNKAKYIKESKTSHISSVSEVKENFGCQSESTEQLENTMTQNSTDFQHIGLLQAQDHYKSPGDILGNLREIRRFVHKSVSEPGTSEELSVQLNKTDASKLMVDAQTMTDASLYISTYTQTESGQSDDRELYHCPHCGKMSGICSSPDSQERKDSGAGKSRGYMRGTASCHVKNNTKKSVSNPLKNSEKDSNKPPIPNGKSSPTPQREKRRPSYSKNDSDGCSSKNRPSTPVSSTPSYMRSTSATRLKEIDKSEPDLRMKRSPSRASSICDGEEFGQISQINKKQSKSLNQLEFSNQDFQTLKMPEVVPKPRSPQKEKAAEDIFFLGNVSSLTEATSALIEKALHDSKQDQDNQNHTPDQCEISTENETSSQSSNQSRCANHTDSVAEMRDKLDKSNLVHVTDGKNSSNLKTSGKPKLSGPKQSVMPALKKSNKAGKLSTPDFQHTKISLKKPAELKGYSKLAGTNVDDAKVVDSTSQFTTIVDNPFIKNDAQCREGLKMKTGPGPNKSVWTKSASANQEREKCTDSADLKPIDSGSKETIETSCDASVKEESVKIANQELEQNIFGAKGADECQDKKHEVALCRTVSMEKQDMQKIHSSSSVLYGRDDVPSAQDVNVMHQVSREQTQPLNPNQHGAGIAGSQRFRLPAGQKPNAIVVETDVDAAFEEYKALKFGSVDNGGRASSGVLENVDHVAFAEKACSKLLGSDTLVDIYKLEKNSKQQNEELDFPDTVVKELQHSPRQSISSESSSHMDSTSMTSEYSTDTGSIGPTSPNDPSDRKQGKKSKSKKGFFKGKFFKR